MASLVYLTSRSNSKILDELMLAGHRVKEAISVSEVLFVCETELVDAIVIAADVEDPDVVEAQMRRITLRLTPETTAREVIWEISLLFRSTSLVIQ